MISASIAIGLASRLVSYAVRAQYGICVAGGAAPTIARCRNAGLGKASLDGFGVRINLHLWQGTQASGRPVGCDIMIDVECGRGKSVGIYVNRAAPLISGCSVHVRGARHDIRCRGGADGRLEGTTIRVEDCGRSVVFYI